MLRLVGDVEARRDPAAARAAYGEALARADALGMRPLAAQCRLAQALLERRAGRWELAPLALDTAIAEFRAMGMSLWLTRAEAELTRAGS